MSTLAVVKCSTAMGGLCALVVALSPLLSLPGTRLSAQAEKRSEARAERAALARGLADAEVLAAAAEGATAVARGTSGLPTVAGIALGMTIQEVFSILGMPAHQEVMEGGELYYDWGVGGVGAVVRPTVAGVRVILLTRREVGAVDGIRVGDSPQQAESVLGAPARALPDGTRFWNRGTYIVGAHDNGGILDVVGLIEDPLNPAAQQRRQGPGPAGTQQQAGGGGYGGQQPGGYGGRQLPGEARQGPPPGGQGQAGAGAAPGMPGTDPTGPVSGPGRAPAVAGIDLGMTEGQVVSILGAPEERGQAQNDVLVLRYPSRGIGVLLRPRRGVVGVVLFTPSAGDLVGFRVGQPTDLVRAAWGEPSEVEGTLLIYDHGSWVATADDGDGVIRALGAWLPAPLTGLRLVPFHRGG